MFSHFSFWEIYYSLIFPKIFCGGGGFLHSTVLHFSPPLQTYSLYISPLPLLFLAWLLAPLNSQCQPRQNLRQSFSTLATSNVWTSVPKILQPAITAHNGCQSEVTKIEIGKKDDESDNEDVERVALVAKHGLAKHSNCPDPTDGLFQMTRDIREALKVLESKVKDLEKNQITVLASPIPDDNTKQGLQKLREEIKELAKSIRFKLKGIEPTKEEQDENRTSFNNRMKRNQHGILSQQFLDLINKCNSIQSDYRDRNLERIKRHLQITGSPGVTDDQLDEMLESGQTEVFIQNITKDTQVTKQALNEIETRHSEILKLERSIQELHDLFMFLATEVELQGDIIDRIEKNILDSGDYVKKGQDHLQQAQESQKKAFKKKFMIGICLSIIALVIILIIILSIAL
ncbi:syntaxin-4 isoform X3 [Erythrolamprus reginae]|uniref:syntaxin-4 isoform X3 n=1 Tax=Erythrolamprus reginae TaxID=121349 RepID=UPI00396CE58A